MTLRNIASLFVTAALVTTALILAALPAFAQKVGSTTGTGTGTTTGTTGIGNTTTAPTLGTTGITGSTGANVPKTTTAPNPIYLTGRVAIDDGSELPGPVTIERVCGGSTHTEGYTDMKGTFGIQLGNESGVFQDAADSPSRSTMGGGQTLGSGSSGALGPSGGGMGSQDRMLENCELRAKLPGFRSQSIILAGRRPMDNPDLGTILMHREAPGEGSTVSVTTLNAPKPARKAFEKGQELLKKNKLGDAREEFEKAVQIDQAFAAAWLELGKLQAEAGDPDMARGSFRVAMKSDPKFVNPYLELSALALNDRKWQEAADLTDQALKLDAFDYPQAYLFNAAAKYNMQEFDAAEKSIIEADRLDARHQYPEVAHLYGAVLQHKKDYAGAVAQYHAYLKMSPNADDAAAVKKQLEMLDKLTTAAK